MTRVLELRGWKAYKAMNAFHMLMLGLKMLPAYISEPYDGFYARIADMSEADQEKMIREAALFVTLEKDELENLVALCTDPNGVPYSSENLKRLDPAEIHELIVAVSKEIAKIRINFVSEAEKKNS